MTLLTTDKAFTAADLARLPEGKGYELVDGELVERVMSVGAVRVVGNVYAALRAESRRTGEATAYTDGLGYQCFPADPDLVRKPDVSVVRTERSAGVTDEQPFMLRHADLAVEVVSPSDGSYAVVRKVQEYLDAGFPLVWVVHPLDRTVTVYRGDRPATLLTPGQHITAEPALAGFRCDVAAFFE